MKSIKKILLICILLASLFLIPDRGYAQIEFSLKLNSDSTRWGVFAKPHSSINPSTETITGSGQITIAASTGFIISDLKYHGGIWSQNSRINSPVENPGIDYISFGLGFDNPKIIYQKGFETLLFSIARIGACPDTLYLISEDDPFSAPNSESTNPNNDITVIDTWDDSQYGYMKNYDFCAWSCEPCQIESTTNILEAPDKEFRIFPNPARDILTIDSDINTQAPRHIQIFNSFGKLVFDEKHQQQNIDISSLPPGLFSLKIKYSKNNFLTKRLQIIR